MFLPIHNGQEWIGQAVRSLLEQSLPPRQILIGDDGSTDATSSILEEFRSPIIEIIRSPQRIGIPRMCNALVERARYRFLARMDGDDICLPDRFQLQVAKLLSSDVSLVGSSVRRFGASDTVHRVATDHDDIVAKMGIHCPIVNPTVMFDRQKLGGSIIYDPGVSHGGDYELFARLRRKARMANLDRILLLWRHHERNVGSDPETLESQNRTVSRVRFAIWEESGIVLSEAEKSALDRLVQLPLPSPGEAHHLLSAFEKALTHREPKELWAPPSALKRLFRDTWNYYGAVSAWSSRRMPRIWFDGCRRLRISPAPNVFVKIALKSMVCGVRNIPG